jgi:deazaflavin-dependent oxidoreductase (nitroreductase family)
MSGQTRAKLKDALFKIGTGLHRAVFTVSKGRISGTALGMPVVKLDTLGRRSGKRRSTMLTVPIVAGERLVLVASFGGDDRHPAWFRNLQANPAVRVTMAGSTRAMIARVATDEEKARLWPQIIATYQGYADYQRRTDRPIPVVILEPR